MRDTGDSSHPLTHALNPATIKRMWKSDRRRGRPVVGPKVETRLPEPDLQKVDAFAEQHDMSRAEALRQLTSDGLLLAESSTRQTIAPGAIQGEKIASGAIESGKADPSDPLFVHTLVVWALKKIGMGQDEADRYATAHQQHAVDAYRADEK